MMNPFETQKALGTALTHITFTVVISRGFPALMAGITPTLIHIVGCAAMADTIRGGLGDPTIRDVPPSAMVPGGFGMTSLLEPH
jgi:ABC-type methionine transport system permease subunit